ncbi:hypothetical protein KUTeg_023962 [Tegillarca granosa]|uniref:Chromo domain-containing protein n=1 Tax=Tegillarca granosa TaxID=220873 RepID=A0ABQ9E156_TEGGR|nr:hypothetical protein KUTeg_023962 [Tegillarca granosa]
MQQDFHVLEQIQMPVILGRDFLNIQKATLDFSNQKLTLQGGITEISLNDTSKFDEHFVKLTKNVKIPPRNIALVEVSIRDTPENKNSVGIIEPNPSLIGKWNVMGGRCLVMPKVKRAFYQLLNPTNTTVHMKKNSIIGYFHEIAEDRIFGEINDKVANISIPDEEPSVLTRLFNAEKQYMDLDPVTNILTTTVVTKEQLQREQQSDPDLRNMVNYMMNGTLPDDKKQVDYLLKESNHYIFDNDILFHLHHPRGSYYIRHDNGNYSFLLRRCSDNKEIRAPVHANRLKHFFDPRNRPTNPPERINDNIDLNPEEIDDAENIQQDNNKTQNVENKAGQTQPQQPNQNDTNSDNLSTQQNSHTGIQNHNNDDQYEVECIFACKKSGSKMEYKIKWLGYTEPTWEPKENVSDELIRQFHVNKTLKNKARKGRRRMY